MSLRLGVTCAVVDDQGRVLLSQRGDLKVWNLPGGRLDSGEALADAAAREVREETGVIVQVEGPVNLYYWQEFRRMNVLYAGWPLGGELRSRTEETRDNLYFSTDSLPKLFHPEQVNAALSEIRIQPETIRMTEAELRRIRRRLSLRWMQNLLRGRPEPRYPQFDVRAVAVIWDRRHQRLLTLEGKRGRTLPRVRCSGMTAPWDELQIRVRQNCGINARLHWVGIWQDAPRDIVEFIFAATVPEKSPAGAAEWSIPLNTPLSDRDLRYAEQVRPSFAQDAVWTLVPDDDLDDDMMISGQVEV